METDGQKHNRKKLRIVLMPIIWLQRGLTRFLKFTVGGEEFEGVTENDIRSLVDVGTESGTIEDSSAEMINNVFEFDDLTASDVMTHRVNIEGIDENASLDDIVYLALEKGFSRLPVYHESIDKIIGIIIVKDLLCLIGKDTTDSFKVSDFLRDVVFIPESCSCSDTFKYLTTLKSGMAVVVDEYGGTAGIITLEDLIESIVGNIEDEYDEEDAEIKKIGKDKYEVSGEADPDEVLELFGYSLPENHEYDTIAGFVTDLLGYIPENTDNHPHVDYESIRFVIRDVEDNCISKLIIFPKDY